MDANRALNQYKKDIVEVEVTAADPHRLIQMLFEGALSRIAIAKQHMEESNVAEKGKNISSAISIVAGLQSSLDFDAGGEIAQNLNGLYDYIQSSLVQANMQDNPDKLQESMDILLEIKSAWDAIADEAEGVSEPPINTDTTQ